MRLHHLPLRFRLVVAVVLIVLAAVGCLLWIYPNELSREAFTEFGRGLPALWFIALFAILPLAGCSISIFLVLAGVRFGFGGGMLLASGAILFHNFAAYHLAHRLRAPMLGWLQRFGYSIPSIEPGQRLRFTGFFAAIHGPPYVVKLYLLPLTDIPFRLYFWVASPIYIFFAALPVAVGGAVTTLDPRWVYGILAGLTIFSLAAYWLRRRLAPVPC